MIVVQAGGLSLAGLRGTGRDHFVKGVPAYVTSPRNCAPSRKGTRRERDCGNRKVTSQPCQCGFENQTAEREEFGPQDQTEVPVIALLLKTTPAGIGVVDQDCPVPQSLAIPALLLGMDKRRNSVVIPAIVKQREMPGNPAIRHVIEQDSWRNLWQAHEIERRCTRLAIGCRVMRHGRSPLIASPSCCGVIGFPWAANPSKILVKVRSLS